MLPYAVQEKLVQCPNDSPIPSAAPVPVASSLEVSAVNRMRDCHDERPTCVAFVRSRLRIAAADERLVIRSLWVESS